MHSQGRKILLVTTKRWYSCARLAMALREAGCDVDAMCPGGHPVRATSAISRVWPCRMFRMRSCLGEAIAGSRPNLIVPCDEASSAGLHELARTTDDRRLRELIESSLGSETSFAVVESRAGVDQLASELGVAVPRSARVDSAAELEQAMAAVGLPAFLKADGSSGGTGVRLIETREQAATAYRRLASRPSILRAVKRAVVDRDWSLLPGAVKGSRSRLSLQQAVAGVEANSTVFCWRGKVMASITMEVLATSMRRGPSTVVRRIDNAEIGAATAAIVKRLTLSGMCGFDFIVERETGRAMLIEINARPTQTSHLALGEGRDLAAAAFAALTGQRTIARPAATRKTLIALFPGEWRRDPESEYLKSGHHDVPLSEPGLTRLCMRKPSLIRRLMTMQRWKQEKEQARGLRPKAVGLEREESAVESFTER